MWPLAQNEEEEVKRLQEKKAQEVSEDDYDDTFGGILSKLKAEKKEDKPVSVYIYVVQWHSLMLTKFRKRREATQHCWSQWTRI